MIVSSFDLFSALKLTDPNVNPCFVEGRRNLIIHIVLSW